MTGKGTPDPQGWADGKIRTRKTNPLYCGSYTIDDYTRDRDSGVMKPETVEFERILLSGFRKNYPEEAERFDRLYGEARKDYDGPTEWEHGYKLNDISHCDQATCWKYFKSYYELTDAEAIDAIKEALEENRDLLSFADEIHPLFLEALEGSDWLQILEERERVRAILNPEYSPKIPTADEFTRDIITRYIRTYLDGWVPDDPIEDGEEQGADEQPDSPEDPFDEPRLAAKTILGFARWAMRKELEAGKRKLTAQDATNKRLGELEAEGYGPLIEYVRANYTEDRARRFRISDLGIYTLYVLTEYKALAGSPPETITADTEALIDQAYQRIEGNTIHYMTLEGQKKTGEDPIDAEAIITGVPGQNITHFMTDMALTPPPENLTVPYNAYMGELRNHARQPTLDCYLDELNKEYRTRISAKKNKDAGEEIISNLLVPDNIEPPSLAELIFIEQIGAEREKALKEGRVLTLTEKQLIRRRYGMADDQEIGKKTRSEFKYRLEYELTNVRIFVPKKGGLFKIPRDPDDSRGQAEDEELGTIIGEKVRLIEPEIELVWNDTKKEKYTIVYKFEKNPIPTRYINRWFGKMAHIPRDLLITESKPADELCPTAKKHYREEGLRGSERNEDKLSLNPVTSANMKLCALHDMIESVNFKQKGCNPFTLNLNDLYRSVYGTDPKSKREHKWKDFVKSVYTFLTFLIEKGCIEDYWKGERGSGLVRIRIPDGSKLIKGPRGD